MNIKAFKGISHKVLQLGLLLMISLSLSSCDIGGGSGKDKSLPADTSPPGDATGLSITTIGGGSVSLTWRDPADTDLDHVEISVEPRDTASVSVVKGTGSATVSGLTADKNYTYTIKVVDTSDNQSAGISLMAYMPAASTPVTFIAGSDAANFHTLLADDVTNGTGGYYILGTDIDLSGYGNWDPVGDGATPFTGTLDGGGHTLSSMTISLPAGPDYQGLFGKLDVAASVRNITLTSVNIAYAGNYYTGALAGMNRGTVSNCSASGEIHGGGNEIGGLVGRNLSGTIKGSSADVAVYDGNYIGGLVGYNTDNPSSISDCHATGAVGTASGTNEFVGGLVGYHNAGSVTNSWSTGNVNALNQGGGIIGSITTANVNGSFSTGAVTCTNYGCGGFVGTNNGGSVDNSFSTSIVSGVDKVGGFVGATTGTVQYCYSSGAVSGTTPGGFTETNTGTITGSYYNSTLAGQTDANATGDIDLTVQSNFSGWDFTNTWAIDGTINGGYPYLQ